MGQRGLLCKRWWFPRKLQLKGDWQLDLTPDQIKAAAPIIVPIVLALISNIFAQMRCRRDLNIAHAMLRARDSGKPWQDELRSNYRYFGIANWVRRRRRKK